MFIFSVCMKEKFLLFVKEPKLIQLQLFLQRVSLDQKENSENNPKKKTENRGSIKIQACITKPAEIFQTFF